MSALSRIRHNMALIVILIALALLAFILTDLFTGLGSFLNAPPDAGMVAGQPISFQEYDERVTNTVNSQSQGPANELTRGRIADQVWDAMVSEIVWDSEMEKSGLEVTGEELYDMFAGKEISPIVRQYLLPPGQPYDQNQMRRQLEQISEDPNLRSQLLQLEDYAARARGIEKYMGIISGGYLGSLTAAQQNHIDQNRRVSISYLAVDFNQISDSSISVSDSDIRNYINDHKDEYKQEAETYIRFARFELAPSRKDTLKAYQTLAKKKEAFSETLNDTSYTSNKSRLPYAEDYQEISTLPTTIQDDIVNAADKTVFGPELDGTYYKLYKLVGTEPAEESSAKIAHILITVNGTTKADSNAARSTAAGLLAQARANFAQTANENSMDPTSNSNGGELGWYRKATFSDDFNQAVNRAAVGSVIGPIKSSRGYHIVKVLNKTNKRYNIAEIEEEISYSTPTRDSVYRAANQFAASVGNTNNINESGAEMDVLVNASNPLNEESRSLLGVGAGREVILWALNADLGDVSQVTRVEDQYIIAQVSDKKEEGTKSVEDVRAEVTAKIRNEKKAEMIKKKLADISSEDLNAMKEAYGDGARIGTAEGITFSSPTIQGIGPENYIIGRVVGMQPGETTEPLVGSSAVYVVQVTGAEDAGEIDEATLASTRDSQALIKRQDLQRRIEPALIKMTDVEDNRAEAERVLRYGIR
jgi:peptidyl-prolyl cis-trans isomerase D